MLPVRPGLNAIGRRAGVRVGGLVLAASVSLLAGVTLAGHAHQSPGLHAQSRPNIVLVVLCAFRFNRIGAAGYWRPLTPNLDRIASRGVFFEHAVSAASWTKPAAASLLTGLTPGVHQLDDYYDVADILGGRVMRKKVLPPNLTTLASQLRANGYDTFARVNNVHAGDYFGVTRGFENQRTDNTVHLDDMVDQLHRWLLARNRSKPFFAMLFTLDTHAPYDPGYQFFERTSRYPLPGGGWEFEKLRVRTENEVMAHLASDHRWPQELQERWIDLYDAGVMEVDSRFRQLQTVLAETGALHDTIFVVTADHGERFFEHGRVDHGWFPDEPVLQVPLILAGPGIPRGRRVSAVVRSIDLYPTIDELLGLENPPLLQGTSLLPLIHGETEPAPRPAFSVGDAEYALRVGRYKLRWAPGSAKMLYDLEADPTESHDLSGEAPEVFQRIEEQLERILRLEAVLRPKVGTARQREVEPAVRNRLRALGYVH